MTNNDLTIINGGVEFPVAMRDGSTEAVKIHQLPIRKLDAYARAQGDEAALVELFCDRPVGWDDTITLDAHLEILRIGEELNADPFAQWMVRLRSRIEKTAGATTSLLASLPSVSVPPGITPAPSSPIVRPPLFSGPIADTSAATPS